jgi:hypothetical protein
VPLGTPNQFNANFVAAAEPVPLSTTGPTYIEQLRAVLRLARTPTSIPDDYEIETINGVEFYRLTIPVGSGEDLAQQKYYVVLRKGYAIALITTIFSESDADTMNSILKSVVIQKK